jgi:membrane fusion protein, multidrug efflux system
MLDRKPSVAMIFWGLWILAIAPAGCGSDEGDAPEQRAQRAIAVQAITVGTQDMAERIHAIGTLEASAIVMIRAETAGIVKQVHFREGEQVPVGSMLFSLDDRVIRHQLASQQAALEAARIETRNARNVYERRQQLREQNIGTQEELEQARSNYQSGAAEIRRLEAEIARIEEILEHTRIRAPLTGYTGERRVNEGDYVAVGEELVPLVQTDPLEIAFNIPERYADRVRVGQALQVQSAVHKDRFFTGEVFFVSPQIDPSTRDLLIKARILNPRLAMRPGGFASVALTVEIRQNVPILPEEALVPTRSGYSVFVVEADIAYRRPVEIGLRQPGLVEIREGLVPGQTVVVSGHIALSEGDTVEIRGSTADSPHASASTDPQRAPQSPLQ